MIKSVKTVFAAMAACGLVMSAASASAADIQERTMRIGIANNPGNPQYDGAQKFADLVAAKSGGKIKIKVFGGNTLGKDTQTVSSLQGGVVDMAILNTNLLVGIVKEAGLLDLPYLFDSEKEAFTVLDSPVGQKIHAPLEAKGLVGLGFFDFGYYHLINNVRPITKIEDVKGLKMRVTETPISIDTMNAFGGNAVPVPYSELYTVLEQRIVDGAGQPVINLVYGKFSEVQKYLTLNRYSYTPQSVLISKKTWDKLSADEKKIINDSFEEAKTFQRNISMEKATECLNEVKKTMKVTELSPAELARFRDAAKPVVDKFAKQYNEALAKELFAEIAKVRGAKK